MQWTWKTSSLMQFKAMPHQRISIQQQPLQSFQLFTYGSGQISNSCHTDKFLESLFESFITNQFKRTRKISHNQRWRRGISGKTTQQMDTEIFVREKWHQFLRYLMHYHKECWTKRMDSSWNSHWPFNAQKVHTISIIVPQPTVSTSYIRAVSTLWTSQI